MELIEEMRFAANMQRLREDRGWSQGELARRMVGEGWETYSQMTVSRTEKLERPIRLSEAAAIARLFGVSLPAMTASAEVGADMLAWLRESRTSLMDAKRNFDIKASEADRALRHVRRIMNEEKIPADSPYLPWIEEVQGDIVDLLDGGTGDRPDADEGDGERQAEG